MGDKIINVGVAGWGLSGRYFHAPFIVTNPNFRITKVVTSKEIDTSLFTDAQQVDNIDDVINDSDIDLVIVATPHFLHYEQAKQAMQAGKHVIIEKPVVRTPEQLRELISISEANHVKLIPFQNRRWDGDFKTVRELIGNGSLGHIHHYHVQWPIYRPWIKDTWKNDSDNMGGKLYDLGAHLIDQAIVLFGKPKSVYAKIEAINKDRGDVDDYFYITLMFENHPVLAIIETDCFNAHIKPRFDIRGSDGTYKKYGLDPQEPRLRAGELPVDDNWGIEDESQWGVLMTNPERNKEAQAINIETQRGHYNQYYQAVYSSIMDDIPSPVNPHEVVWQLQVIQAAFESSRTNTLQLID